jgi:ATP-binding cassette, subfamily B, bacterial
MLRRASQTTGTKRDESFGRQHVGLVADGQSETPAALQSAANLVRHYVRERAGWFALLIGLVSMAAGSAVGVQYVMKFLVDAMTQQAGAATHVWWLLGIFIALIALESLLWRVSGWLGSRLTLDVGVDVRLDLFDYLASQPMRYFAENLAGSLGQRVTATAGNLGALINTCIWRITPPCVDFIGALLVFVTIDWRMAVALATFVVI